MYYIMYSTARVALTNISETEFQEISYVAVAVTIPTAE